MLETTILALAQTVSRPTHADTTNDTTDTLETTILAQSQSQTQTTSFFHHPATKNYAATDITQKLPVFQSHFDFQTARPQLLPAAIHFISSQFLRRSINCIPPSSTATTTKCPPPNATLHTSPKTWTLQGYLHPIASTDILLHSPLHIKHLNLYSHISVAPTAPTIAYLQQQT
jgi:hypothetical protein